jgi:cytochrome c
MPRAAKFSTRVAKTAIRSRKTMSGACIEGVVGRLSGTVPGYNYSPALRNAKVVWSEANLDKWLTDPQEFVPGTKMFYEVNNPQDRADLIAFLKERAR